MISETKHVELPQSQMMERTVLGAALLDERGTSTLLESLIATDFLFDSHQKIYRAIKRLHDARSGVDMLTVMTALQATRELDAVGGAAYLAELTEGIPRVMHLAGYIGVIKEKARQRSQLAIGNRLAHQATEGEDSRAALSRGIDDLRELLFEADGIGLQSVQDYIDDLGPEPDVLFDHLTSRNGVRVGFDNLDAATGGFEPGDLVIVAARPSMGKTAWACNAAASCAVRGGLHTAFFSLEMKKRFIVRRMLAASTRIDYKTIKEGRLRQMDKDLLHQRMDLLKSAPLYMNDLPKLTVSRMRTMCERQKAQSGLDIVFIDQLSKINDADVRERGMPKHERVGAQSTALKQMAQELGVPVVVFNQLSRESTKRADPRPVLSDLKESGSIEEDADVVILLHRPEYYDKTDESLKGVGEQIIAKLREGETKTIKCSYRGEIMRWEDTADHAAEQQSLPSGTYFDSPPDSYWQQY